MPGRKNKGDPKAAFKGQHPIKLNVTKSSQAPAGIKLNVTKSSQAPAGTGLYQRSADILLGVPFNIASYALLTMMVAQVCDLEVGDFIHTFGDAHLYSNHAEQVETQLTREPFPLPRMKINPKIDNIFDFTFDDFELLDYQSHPGIRAPIAI